MGGFDSLHQRPSSAPRIRASGDVTATLASLRDEERRSKLARELEKAATRATKARMKAEVLTYTVVSGRPPLAALERGIQTSLLPHS